MPRDSRFSMSARTAFQTACRIRRHSSPCSMNASARLEISRTRLGELFRVRPERDELCRAHVAAAADERDVSSREPRRVRQHRGQRGRARELDEVAGLLDHHPRRFLQRVLRDQDEVVEFVPQNLLRQLERGARGQSLGQGGVGARAQRARLPGPLRRRGGLGLHADDLNRRPDRLGHDAGASGPAAAADRDHDDLGVRLRLQDLQGVGADPGDQRGLVARVDVAVAVLGGQLLAVLAGLVEVAPVQHHLGAEGLHRLHLHRVGLLRCAHDRAHAEQVRRVGDRLAMVAGRRRDHARAALRRAELAHQVHAAADLERADWLVVLVLDPGPRAGQLVERRIAIQRGRAQVGGDALTGREHVSEVGYGRCAHGPFLPRVAELPACQARGRARGRGYGLTCRTNTGSGSARCPNWTRACSGSAGRSDRTGWPGSSRPRGRCRPWRASPRSCGFGPGTAFARDGTAAAAGILDEAEERIPAGEQKAYAALRAEVAGLDGGDGLPHALTHPDFVLANVIPSPSRGMVMVDWTGSGQGPRLWSLAFLLYAAGGRGLNRVDSAIRGYLTQVRPEPEELDRLAGLIRVRPAMFGVWAVGQGRKSVAEAWRGVTETRALTDAVAARALIAFGRGTSSS